MKKLLLVCLMMIHFTLLWSNPITKSQLQSVTFSFIENCFPQNKPVTIREIIPVTTDQITTFFIINLHPEGWVLVAADDKVEPILAFNFTGFFDPGFQEAVSVNKWMGQYEKNISVASSIRTLAKNKMWDMPYNTKSSTASVEPLIDAIWDQDASYNQFCPVDPSGPGGHAYVGCVAVSMAQAMSVYKYPSSGTGTKSYFSSRYGDITVRFDQETFQWDLMSSSVSDPYNSRLLYDCAVSVSMNFGPNGSGSFTSRIPAAMKTYFKYPSVVKRVTRSGSDSAWIQLMVSELKSGRPIIYSGDANDNESGHAFNIDGVNNGKYFHLNWGWSGAYNGYFLITDLTPGIYDFSANHEAIINIKPPDIVPIDIQLSKVTVKEEMPEGTFVAKINILNKVPDNTYTLNLLGDSIDANTYLSPEFYLSNDTIRTLRSFSLIEQASYPVFVRITDRYNNTFQKKFNISIVLNSSEKNGMNANSIMVFPNPSSGFFNVKVPDVSELTFELLDLSGRIVYHNQMSNEESNEICVHYSVPGIYMLKISDGAHSSVYKKVIIH